MRDRGVLPAEATVAAAEALPRTGACAVSERADVAEADALTLAAAAFTASAEAKPAAAEGLVSAPRCDRRIRIADGALCSWAACPGGGGAAPF